MRIAEFIIACTIIEITPGPNMGYIITIALTRGIRAALSTVAGIATGLAVLGLFAAFGLTEFLQSSPAITAILRWSGIAFMIWLAIEAWRDARRMKTTPSTAQGSFWRGLVANILSPKSLVFYLTVMPDFADQPHALSQNLILVGISVAIATIIHILIIIAAAHAGNTITHQIWRARIQRFMAFLLLGVAFWIYLDSR